jgi:hypothetical protein
VQDVGDVDSVGQVRQPAATLLGIDAPQFQVQLEFLRAQVDAR